MNNGFQQPMMNNGVPMQTQQKNTFLIPMIIGLVGSVIAIIGTFFKFCTITVSMWGVEQSETVNYLVQDGQVKDGIFVLVLMIIAIVLIIFRKSIFSIIPAGISGLIVIADIADASSKAKEISYVNVDIKFFGAYIILAGLAIVIAHIVTFVIFNPKNLLGLKNPKPKMAMPYGMPMQGPMGPQPMNQTMPGPMGPQPMGQPMPGPMGPQPMGQPMPGPMGQPIGPAPMPMPMEQPMGPTPMPAPAEQPVPGPEQNPNPNTNNFM